jgi:hypothetical protein
MAVQNSKGGEMIRSPSCGYHVPALVLAVLLAFPAATFPAEPAEQRPCMNELDKFCKEVKPGEGRIIKCLQEHDQELSAVCRDKVQSILKRLEEAKQACGQDIGTFCADVKPGGGRLIKCLSPHFNELAPTCREKLGPIKARYEGETKPAR